VVFPFVLFIGISVFYLIYFAKQRMLRKQGITANRLAKGSKPAKTAAIETCLLVVTYGMALVQYASVFFSVHMLPFSLPAVLRWIGAGIMACGICFFLLAVIVMRDSWRAGVDESQSTAIVTSGVYKVSRNPAFVGFDLLYIGSALVMPNVLLWGLALVGVVLLHLQILEEEKFLCRAFGEEYVQYLSKTPRYFL